MKYLDIKSIQDFLQINSIIKIPTPPSQIERIMIVVKSKKGDSSLELESSQLSFQIKNKYDKWADCDCKENNEKGKYGLRIKGTIYNFIKKHIPKTDLFEIEKTLKEIKIGYEFISKFNKIAETPAEGAPDEEGSKHTIPSLDLLRKLFFV